MRRLSDAGFSALPALALKQVQDQIDHARPGYPVHEYLNEGWQPLWGAWVRDQMARRGLTYLGQSTISYSRPDLWLTENQRAALQDVTDADLRETLMDIATDIAFRVDLFGRDPIPADNDAYDRTWLMACKPPETAYVAPLPSGIVRFDNRAARGILRTLQDGPASVLDLSERLRLSLADIRNATDCLLLGEHVRPCAPPGDGKLADRLNRKISQEVLTPAGPSCEALAGLHGPVPFRPLNIALLYHTPDQIKNAARSEQAVFARLFHDGVDPDDPAVSDELSLARDDARRLARTCGVPRPVP